MKGHVAVNWIKEVTPKVAIYIKRSATEVRRWVCAAITLFWLVVNWISATIPKLAIYVKRGATEVRRWVCAAITLFWFAVNWIRATIPKVLVYIKRGATEAHRSFRAGCTIWRWLALTFAILLFFYLLPAPLSDRVLWSGTLFEFLGVGAVVIGIDRARVSFGRPSLFKGMRIWIEELRFIFIRRPPISLSARAMMGAVASMGVAAVVATSTGTTEERVAQLEKDVRGLQTSMGEIHQKVDQQKREFRAELDKEAAERHAGDQGVSKKLEESMVGDSPLDLAGVAYVLLGLAMAHLSEEVALVFGWLGLT
jgi:hypothetical protein